MSKILSEDACNMIAESIEDYRDLIENATVIQANVSAEEYYDALKTIKKLVKKLRAGKAEAVIEPEMLAPYRDEIEEMARTRNHGEEGYEVSL